MVLIDDFLLTEKAEKKKQKNKEKGFGKETINVIRTTQRNNVELSHLADNKANVLLSLNAIMLTFLLPGVISNSEYILEGKLLLPVTILALTCFSTIYISTMVLKPSRFDRPRYFNTQYKNHSPLFFGNIYKMTPDEFFDTMDQTFADKAHIMDFLKQDLYYSGKRLGYKMTWIRRAFNIFLMGLAASIITVAIVFSMGNS